MASPEANIVRLFHQAAARYPDRDAIVQGKEHVTYAELRGQVLAMAARLRDRGLRPGDRVLVFVPMGIPLYRTVLAIFHIGATAVFLDEWVSWSRMETCCRLADCRGFVGIFKARALAWFSPALRRIPIRLGAALDGRRGPAGTTDGDDAGPARVADGDTALITFTTGSTGVPKAAKRTHGFLRAQFDALIDTLKPRPDEVDLTTLPIVLLLNLGVGATSVIVPYKASRPERTDWSRMVALVVANGVNRITASPFFVSQLAHHVNRQQRRLPALQRVVTGGAPVFPDEASRYADAFPQASVEVVYGSTEAEPISSLDAQALIADGDPQPGLLVGEVYAGADVRIIAIRDGAIACQDDAALHRLVLPDGQIGEIIVAGAHVLTAYVNNDEALRRNKIFVDGRCWHRTGDSGYLSGDRLYLTGRCNTLIERAGLLISTFVHEYRMRNIPGIACGTLLEIGGELVAAVECDRANDRRAITEALHAWGLPIARIQWMERIPRDPRHHSKIDYEALRLRIRP